MCPPERASQNVNDWSKKRASSGRDPLLFDGAAPGDVTGVARLDPGNSRRRASEREPSAQIKRSASTSAALREAHDDPPVRRLERGQRRAGVVMLVREGRPQRPVDRIPGGEPLRHGGHDAVAAVGHEVAPLHARGGGQLGGTVPAQQAQQVVLDHDAGASAGHRAQRAFVDLHLAADPVQRDPGAQAADRPPGHGDLEGWTAPEHLLPLPADTHWRKRCSAAEARSTDGAGKEARSVRRPGDDRRGGQADGASGQAGRPASRRPSRRCAASSVRRR